MNIVIGTPVHQQSAYVLDKFLSNQKQIQHGYQSSELILASLSLAGNLTNPVPQVDAAQLQVAGFNATITFR